MASRKKNTHETKLHIIEPMPYPFAVVKEMFSKTMEKQIIIYLFFGGVIKSIAGETPILEIFDSDNEDGTEEGSSFTLNCTVTINDIVLFKLNDTVQASCNAPFGPALGTCNPNTITQSLATSVTSWTISPATPAHVGSWKCTLGSDDSIAESLKIYKLPSAVVTTSGISSDTIVNETSSYPVVVQIDCMFSQNGPSMELQFFEGVTSRASVKMTCTTLSSACSPCTGCSAYSCRHTLIFDQAFSSGRIEEDTSYTLKINVGVTGTTETFSKNVFEPHTITFKSTSVPPKSNTNCIKHVPCCFLWALVGNVIGIVIVLIFNCKKGLKCKEICEEVTWTLLISVLYDMPIPMPVCYYLCPDNENLDMIAILYGLLITLIVAFIAYKYVTTRGWQYLLIIFTLTIVSLVLIVVVFLIWFLLTESYLNILDSNKTISPKCGTTVVLVISEAGYKDGQWKKSDLKKKGDVQTIRTKHLCKFLPPVLIFWNIKKEDEGVYYCESGVSKSKELTIEVNGESQKKTNSPIKDEESAMNPSTESSPIKDEESAMNPSTERRSTNSIMPKTHDDDVLVNDGMHLPPIPNPNGTNGQNENEKAKTKKKQLKKEKRGRKKQENNPMESTKQSEKKKPDYDIEQEKFNASHIDDEL